MEGVLFLGNGKGTGEMEVVSMRFDSCRYFYMADCQHCRRWMSR